MRTKALSAGARSLDGARLGGGGGASASFPSADFCPSTARRSNFVCIADRLAGFVVPGTEMGGFFCSKPENCYGGRRRTPS